MGWQDIGVLVAMIGVIGGFVLTWRGQGQDKHIAEAGAQRAEAAAALSAEYSERVVLALEAIARKDFAAGGAPVAAAPKRVRWTLAHQSGDMYRLENVGDVAADDVRIGAHESMVLRVSQKGFVLQPDEATTFMAVRTMGTQDSTIHVLWKDEAHEGDQEWKYPLPPRPPRN